ncbi:MFS transporter [Pandoraea eparura]|uniref:MFS transporter n=1 Tax=Pandoraea eparura TaxID=2508291 RepID=A0A5E4U630_9BURK|nr:MFS transporter [Pandoraea eparura]VVD95527.1 MFS transporter [Pandoraea eparura]
MIVENRGAPLSDAAEAVCRKVLWRLMPVLFLSYLFCSMDRFNVSFAQLQLKEALQFSDSTYGLGASLFFVTYVLFEVPVSAFLKRFGARRVFCTIMIGWGLCSAATLLVQSAGQFYAVRLLLGVSEAGFYPGVIYYLSTWLPLAHRSKAVAIFALGIVVAGVVTGPISGLIMTTFDGVGNLGGWQWLFLLEALPSLFMAAVCAVRLADRPEQAEWLSRLEVDILNDSLQADLQRKTIRMGGTTLGSLLREPKIYLFALVFFCATSGTYAMNFWVPSIIRGFGVVDPLMIGMYSVVPWGSAAIATVLIARNSDRTGERRWHFAATAMVGAAGLAASATPNLPFSVSLLFLSIGAIGVSATLPIFWSMPSAAIDSKLVAGGLALINSIGASSGIVAPFVVGLMKEATGSMASGLYLLAVLLCCGGLLLLKIVPPMMLPHDRHMDNDEDRVVAIAAEQ